MSKNINNATATLMTSIMAGVGWVIAFFTATGVAHWLGFIPAELINLTTLILMFVLHGPTATVFSSFTLLAMMAGGAVSTLFQQPKKRRWGHQEDEE